MELEQLETEWYADGLEARLHLHLRAEGEPPPYIIEIERPSWERYSHAPQWPDTEGGLTCLVPRESFEGGEILHFRVKGPGTAGRQIVYWESEAQALQVDGQPLLEMLPARDLPERKAA